METSCNLPVIPPESSRAEGAAPKMVKIIDRLIKETDCRKMLPEKRNDEKSFWSWGLGSLLIIFGRRTRLDIGGADLTGALGRSKNSRSIFVALDGEIEIVFQFSKEGGLTPSHFNTCG